MLERGEAGFELELELELALKIELELDLEPDSDSESELVLNSEGTKRRTDKNINKESTKQASLRKPWFPLSASKAILAAPLKELAHSPSLSCLDSRVLFTPFEVGRELIQLHLANSGYSRKRFEKRCSWLGKGKRLLAGSSHQL